jgi:hypothetical protein
MQLEFDPVRKMLAWLVDHHVPAGDHEQPRVALEEEAAGIGQAALAFERADARRGQQHRFDLRRQRPPAGRGDRGLLRWWDGRRGRRRRVGGRIFCAGSHWPIVGQARR